MCSQNAATRTYRKRRRAELERQTRRRITEAAVELHGSVGPARTTISAVAERAGVQRATVYRHFPTEESLFDACSAHYLALHPMPEPASWAAVGDHGERLRHALAELYAWYGTTEAMLERTSRDRPLVPAMGPTAERFGAYVESLVDALVDGRPERGAARRRVRAAVGHAVSFNTWQSLTRAQNLVDRDAVALMSSMVETAARPER